jgi:hypothetical protein
MHRFFNSCVGWCESDVHAPGGLCDLIDNRRTISRRTFLRHVDRDELRDIERDLGYGAWLRMAADWHVEYFRSTLHGRRVYGFRHSAIEYVFTSGV